MRAVVVGAGPGGLACALGLLRVGIEVRVLEQAPEIREVGAALGLWSNAVRALDALGVAERVVARGSVFERIRTERASGETIAEFDLRGLAPRAGAPSICVHRADLQAELLAALGAERVQTGARCVGLRFGGDRVAAEIEGGGEVEGDLVVGADGIHSAVRSSVHGGAAPRYAGYVAWRGVAPGRPIELPADVALFVLAPGSQAGVFACGGRGLYWFLTENRRPLGSSARRPGKGDLLARLERGHRHVRAVVEATPDRAVLVGDVADRPPLRRWGRGRMTLVGDAAHPTTPNLAQGACQAIEDAVALAGCLAGAGGGGDEVERALRAFERARRRRTAWVTRQSRLIGAAYQWERPALVRLRDAYLGSRLGVRLAERGFEELLCAELPRRERLVAAAGA